MIFPKGSAWTKVSTGTTEVSERIAGGMGLIHLQEQRFLEPPHCGDTEETWSSSGLPAVIALLSHPVQRVPLLHFQFPIPQMGELRPRVEKRLSQGHKASRSQNQKESCFPVKPSSPTLECHRPVPR